MSESFPPVIDLMQCESDPQSLSSLTIRIKNELMYFAGREMPAELLIAWHAFLYGYLEGGSLNALSLKDYDRLKTMLPPLPTDRPNPIATIASGRSDEELGL